MYTEKFKKIVSFAFDKSEIFYNNRENEESPNPYYIGFGNPNAEILILGKEKGFDKEGNLEQLKCESINNPKEWKCYIDNHIKPNAEKICKSTSGYINAFKPYDITSIDSEGHTWRKYDKLLKNIYSDIESFLCRSFISEVNYFPSKYSKIKRFNNEERIAFLSKEYYKSFPVIICACGNYLSKVQIEEIFNVKFEKDESNTNERFVVYKSNDNKRILINTRQLSTNVSNKYLSKIAKEVKGYLKEHTTK